MDEHEIWAVWVKTPATEPGDLTWILGHTWWIVVFLHRHRIGKKKKSLVNRTT